MKDDIFKQLGDILNPNIEKTKTLNEVWLSKLEYANRHLLLIFSFHYDGKTYLSEWKNAKWNEPKEITEL